MPRPNGCCELDHSRKSWHPKPRLAKETGEVDFSRLQLAADFYGLNFLRIDPKSVEFRAKAASAGVRVTAQ